MKALKKAAVFFIMILFTSSCMNSGVLTALTAAPTSSSIFVDGKSIALQAYTVGENNYFKLRDIAMVLSGTEKQFDVEYNAASNFITLRVNRAYTPVGGEMAAPGGSAGVTAEYMTSKVYLDSAPINLAAYTIKGNNYFKLRDIGAAIDFDVIWDGLSNAIRIDTTAGYEETEPTEEAVISVQPVIADHTSIKLDQIPVEWIEKARTDLHIAYGHTSHGSQIITGLLGLTQFKGSPYLYGSDLPGSLDLRDTPFGDGSYMDLGQPDNKTWAKETRTYLQNHPDINVVMWSWCGQLSSADDQYVSAYLSLMQALETEFPDVVFVYMTGHLDGTGDMGTLALNNTKIREYCKENGKVLYDFADIESYNPDGLYFGDKYANDACDYTDGNWAIEWQNTHREGVDWYACSSEHSQPVNANMKAYAAWWLMARLAGWAG
jgi:hypothetical protein